MSSSIILSLIFKPLLIIALRVSLLEDKIFSFDIKSRILIPFLISLNLTFISGKSEPNPPFSNVSFAVFSAFLQPSYHVKSL